MSVNPPAFPSPAGPINGNGDPLNYAEHGMSLRDYFAAQAMGHALYEAANQEEDYNSAAQRAYEFADAMLKARETVPA